MAASEKLVSVSLGLILVMGSFYYWFFRLWDERLIDVIIAIVIFGIGIAVVYSNIDRPSGKMDLQVKELSMG